MILLSAELKEETEASRGGARKETMITSLGWVSLSGTVFDMMGKAVLLFFLKLFSHLSGETDYSGEGYLGLG